MPDQGTSRRRILTSVAAAGIGRSLLAQTPPAESAPETGQDALRQLMQGNARFAAGMTRHAHESADWRKHLIAEQKPFATILGCSDSRVPPELIFDQGFGDLFVVRVAGNVIATDVVGSIAYAAFHLRTSLFVVLGHVNCGAVSAALDAKRTQPKEPEKIQALVRMIEPGLARLDMSLEPKALLAAAVESNVRWSVSQLRRLPESQKALAERRVALVGAVYDLTTGKIRLLDQ